MKPVLPILMLLTLATAPAFAQDDNVGEEPIDERFTIDTPVTLDFEKEEEEEPKKKKKKVKKKVFYGVKTKKGFTRTGTGNRVTYELFYVLKKSEKPQTFVRDLYWYDYTRKEIRKTEKFDPAKGVLLHGPYEKRLNDVVLAKGIFYKGTKHGRWMYYNRDSTLSDKEKYFRGWPKESTVSYYDAERKKMKEITPVEFGERAGYYFRFFENGQIAIQGEYEWDQKVGDWTEYYPNKRRKRIIAYPEKPFENNHRPYIKAEWNDKGKQIYRNTRAAR
jgi:antitoxin component YwqK of YwqJK toxin-antitoxin module